VQSIDVQLVDLQDSENAPFLLIFYVLVFVQSFDVQLVDLLN
jgi:hypothetical protein